MLTKKIFLTASFVLCLSYSQAYSQGGWRQWEIHFLDGTVVEASPLQMRANGRFTRSMDPKEAAFERSKIDYIAAIVRNQNATSFPAVPTGKFKQDLIVMLDGTRSFGKVTFKSVKFSEGTIIQNRKEMTLENVAYIKFARST